VVATGHPLDRRICKRYYSSNKNEINPEVIYSNTDIQKELIFKDNKGKSGVYR
jgi:hypothetical protein